MSEGRTVTCSHLCWKSPTATERSYSEEDESRDTSEEVTGIVQVSKDGAQTQVVVEELGRHG